MVFIEILGIWKDFFSPPSNDDGKQDLKEMGEKISLLQNSIFLLQNQQQKIRKREKVKKEGSIMLSSFFNFIRNQHFVAFVDFFYFFYFFS